MEQQWNRDSFHLLDVQILSLDHGSEGSCLSDESVEMHSTNDLNAAKENHHDDILDQIQYTSFELEMRRQLSILELDDVMEISNSTSGLEANIAVLQRNTPLQTNSKEHCRHFPVSGLLLFRSSFSHHQIVLWQVSQEN